MPVLDTLSTNHRQLIEVRPYEAPDHTELTRAIRSLQAQRDLMSMIQLAIEENHRNLVDVVKTSKTDLLNALRSMGHDRQSLIPMDSRQGDSHALEVIARHESRIVDVLGNIERQAHHITENVESNNQQLNSIADAIHLQANHQPQSPRHSLTTIHERLDAHSQNMLNAIEARMDRGLRSEEEAELSNETAMMERIVASSQDVITSVQAAKSEHLEVMHALHGLVSELHGLVTEVHQKPDLAELRQAFHRSSDETVQKIVTVIENAVDHSPLLEAIGGFELKGHSEVLEALRQVQIDLHMEPDYRPVLRAIGELEGKIQSSQAAFSSHTSDKAAPSRRKYIVTLGDETNVYHGVQTSPLETAVLPILRAISEVPGIQQIQGVQTPYTWTATDRPGSPSGGTWTTKMASPTRCVWPTV